MNTAVATPNLLTDPGFLYWAPPGTIEPPETVLASVYSVAWATPWVPLGMTVSGSVFTPSLTTAPIVGAEQIDPIAYRTTDRSTSISFMLMNFTATNLSRAMNGGTTTITGATTTLSTKFEPPVPGTEVRCMLGWESLDSTVRWVARQCINSGSLAITLAKAPAAADIPFTAQLEKPLTLQPFSFMFAGTARS